MDINVNKRLFDFIDACPSAYHTAACCAEILSGEGYSEIFEGDVWPLCAGGKYFVRRASSLIAFRLPLANFSSFMISAAHGDSPALKIRENVELEGKFGTRLSVEKYGGMNMSSWLDRPLSVAGRAMVKTGDGAEMRLVDFKAPCAVIPSVAPHINKDKGEINPAKDLLPLYRMDGLDFKTKLCQVLSCEKEDILSADLFLYNAEKGFEGDGFICAPRLDDLQCVFASLIAFISAGEGSGAPMFCLFDNEEVGSATKQGADSTFLSETLCRICASLGYDSMAPSRILSQSLMLSCDNAHATHPNHPETADANAPVYLNGGVVLKFNANQRYTTDAISAGLFKMICEKCGTPVQTYVNRADIPGGSTLGNISNTHVSLATADIGAPQLAMHSALETAGDKDTEHLIKVLTEFFESAVEFKNNKFRII